MNNFETNTNRFFSIRGKCKDSFLSRKTLFIFSSILVALAIILGNSTAIHAAESNTTFQVNVKESLSVAITAPSDWANGDANEFLRNDINVSVTTNNANGFRASMFSQNTTNLVNMISSTETIPTLGSGTSYTCTSTACTAFPANYWGYSLNDGSNTGTYYPMVSTSAAPITLINASAGTTTGSQDVYFGAKADMTKSAGTYVNTVIISVVTGVIDNNNPATPTNPANPNNNSNTATYNPSPVGGSTNGTTTYTYRRTNSAAGTRTTTTQVSDGDNVSAYSGYTPPQGVRESITTTESINDDASVAAGLATAATIAAGTGLFFFVLAKRREDDEEDEEQQML